MKEKDEKGQVAKKKGEKKVKISGRGLTMWEIKFVKKKKRQKE